MVFWDVALRLLPLTDTVDFLPVESTVSRPPRFSNGVLTIRFWPPLELLLLLLLTVVDGAGAALKSTGRLLSTERTGEKETTCKAISNFIVTKFSSKN
jgi:hypothetical protein